LRAIDYRSVNPELINLGAMPTLAAGMKIDKEIPVMPTASVGMAPFAAPVNGCRYRDGSG
jgi:hypothetical protein